MMDADDPVISAPMSEHSTASPAPAPVSPVVPGETRGFQKYRESVASAGPHGFVGTVSEYNREGVSVRGVSGDVRPTEESALHSARARFVREFLSPAPVETACSECGSATCEGTHMIRDKPGTLLNSSGLAYPGPAVPGEAEPLTPEERAELVQRARNSAWAVDKQILRYEATLTAALREVERSQREYATLDRQRIDLEQGSALLRQRLADAERGNTELREGLSWALDLMDIGDKRLVELGDPPHCVYSAIHLAGKAKARAALASRTTEGAK